MITNVKVSIKSIPLIALAELPEEPYFSPRPSPRLEKKLFPNKAFTAFFYRAIKVGSSGSFEFKFT
jgi:hypothetical protein